MLDAGFFLVIMFLFIVITIAAYPLLKEFNDEVQADNDYANTTKEVLDVNTSKYPSLFDNIFIVVFVVFWALVMIASWNIDAHPVFFIFTAIVTLFLIIAAGMLSNYYEDFASDEEYSSYVLLFPMMNFVGLHFAHVVVVVIISISLSLFGKTRFG